MMRLIYFVAAFFLIVNSALAAGFSSSPAPSNIYSLDYTTAAQGNIYSDTSGKGGVQSASITGGQSTLVLLVVSQSISASSTPTAYTPTNALAQQLNINDGNVYKAIDPLLGTTGQPPSGSTFGGSVTSRLIDSIITASKFARVIAIPVSIGGTTVNDWSPLGPWNGRLRVALLRIRSMGWIGNPDVTFRVLYDQGTNDNTAGTSQAAWQASFQQVVAFINSFGLGKPKICIAQDTMASNVTSSAIRAAQSAVVDNVQIFSAGDWDTLTGGTNRQDGTHLTDAGAASAAGLARPCVAP